MLPVVAWHLTAARQGGTACTANGVCKRRVPKRTLRHTAAFGAATVCCRQFLASPRGISYAPALPLWCQRIYHNARIPRRRFLLPGLCVPTFFCARSILAFVTSAFKPSSMRCAPFYNAILSVSFSAPAAQQPPSAPALRLRGARYGVFARAPFNCAFYLLSLAATIYTHFYTLLHTHTHFCAHATHTRTHALYCS